MFSIGALTRNVWTILLCLIGMGSARAAEPTPEQIRFFETSIRPAFVEHCIKCHGPAKQWGNFRLDTRDGLLKGGEGGEVVITGQPDKSRLMEAVRQANPDFKMPPEGKLSDRQIADLARWIEMGAPYANDELATKQRVRDPNHWSFQPMSSPSVPQVRQKDRVQTAIDQFVLQKLEERDIPSAELADKSFLIRRMTFDLLGLPPAPDDVVEFIADTKPDAIARLIDRLLASPHYGERWGRHWLDVARYADSNGLDENVAHGNAWRYRDYVVAAFNRDEPYDQFLRQQLAGDLLPAVDEAERRELLIATGFLCIGPKVLAEVDQAKMQMDIVDEQIESVGKAILGMTFGCARCHDHKFDPVPTADYYGLAGIFKSTRTMETYTKVARWHEHLLPSDEARTRQAEFDQQVMQRQQAVDKLVQDATEVIRQKTAEQKTPEDVESQFPEETQKKLKQLRGELEAFKTAGPDLPSAMGVTEDKVADVAIHIRGNTLKLGDVVPRHVPLAMRGPDMPQFSDGRSGRAELAAWITNPRHPLTSRVLVNRVWRWHFGRGVVASTDNFGLLGEQPTHPELLDWLAQRFVADGWSIKSLHRMILDSHTWQQNSAETDDQLTTDPQNQWLGHANIHRLEAEEFRDALLAVSGEIDTSMSGSLLNVKNRAHFFDHTSIDKTDYRSRRRSLYLPIVRNNVYDLFQLLDFPDPGVTTGDRAQTTVATQALLVLNSDLVMQSAAGLSRQMMTVSDDRQKLSRLFLTAYGRPATDAEQQSYLAFLRELEPSLVADHADTERPVVSAWDVLCHVILAANEFIYLR